MNDTTTATATTNLNQNLKSRPARIKKAPKNIFASVLANGEILDTSTKRKALYLGVDGEPVRSVKYQLVEVAPKAKR